jgi:hypothetical protein
VTGQVGDNLLDRVDPGIKNAVAILRAHGIETDESCEGTRGHCYPEPTVTFHGDHAEGFKALSIALQHGLKPVKLRRYWHVIDGEPVGPHWEMTFYHPNGGGLQLVKQENGELVYEWGQSHPTEG